MKHHLLAILYVDNTDLLHIDQQGQKRGQGAIHHPKQHQQLGEPPHSYWRSLAAEQMLLLNYGLWRYANNSLKGEFGITDPMPGGREAAIGHKSINHVEKNLGAMTSLDGNSAASLQMIQEKAQQWINAVRNGHLHCRNVWFSLKVQFWPRIGYGLCSLMATFHELESALH
jgi:hypothetical protein